jgi:hypothetical protein
MKKQSYFNGTEPPTPKKKKYKSDPAIVVQPRFEEPFYRNYDLYEAPGVSDKPKHGPGAGWHSMQNYKSIKDFLKSRRKKLKNKYKANDSWIKDNGEITKSNSSKFREFIRLAFDNNDIDFPSDDLNSWINTEDSGRSMPVTGLADPYTPNISFNKNKINNFGLGVDMTPEEDINIDEELDEFIDRVFGPAESPMLGLPDGVEEEFKDADQTGPNSSGTTNSGNISMTKLPL